VRFLILSDIHANWEALDAVLQETAGRYEEIVVCGDFVGYGADPNRVIEWARGSVQSVLRGNHDKACAGLLDLEWFNAAARVSSLWTHDALSSENLDYLRKLPQGPIESDGFAAIHGSPADEDEYLITRSEIASIVDELERPLTFFGHTHLQGAFLCHRNGVKELAKPARTENERAIELEADAFFLINPGSVGQPRDADPRAAYVLYDSEQQIISMHRVPYAVGKAQEKIRKAGLPDVLAQRLAFGR
jgi:diadenosine tetraphosphatase ApaH/serine/threonine PP2A family protein phosphatase